MNAIVVITELSQLPPEERWPRFVEPLAAALGKSGLGWILELDSLQREANEFGRIRAKEVAVELVNGGYGRELIERLVVEAGFERGLPICPRRWREYHCQDYFASKWAKKGCWDEPSQLMLILPADEVEERPELSFVVVGRPGVDGIEFGYRKGYEGVWAYYPTDGEFVLMARSVDKLATGWQAGNLSV